MNIFLPEILPVVLDCPLMAFLQRLPDFAFLCFIRSGNLSDLRERLSGEVQWKKMSVLLRKDTRGDFIFQQPL